MSARQSEPTPTAGMPEFYAHIQKLITPASPFFYLSASPYNLYPFLRDFRDAHYPHGQLILRDASWMSLPGLLSNLTVGTQEYKVDRIKKINGWLPGRKTILIGDSTQTDPESYGEIYRTFPAWVKLILIRKVTNISGSGMAEKNEPGRFEKAFKNVPRRDFIPFPSLHSSFPKIESPKLTGSVY
jgi:phosphatidate phosphatase APP1